MFGLQNKSSGKWPPLLPLYMRCSTGTTSLTQYAIRSLAIQTNNFYNAGHYQKLSHSKNTPSNSIADNFTRLRTFKRHIKGSSFS